MIDLSREIDRIILKWEAQRGRIADMDRLRSMCLDIMILTVREVLKQVREPDGPGL